MEASVHVTLSGDKSGAYLVTEEREDGTLVLEPELPYQASLRERGMREMTPAEFDAWMAEHGQQMLPPDGEG